MTMPLDWKCAHVYQGKSANAALRRLICVLHKNTRIVFWTLPHSSHAVFHSCLYFRTPLNISLSYTYQYLSFVHLSISLFRIPLSISLSYTPQCLSLVYLSISLFRIPLSISLSYTSQYLSFVGLISYNSQCLHTSAVSLLESIISQRSRPY